MRAMPGVTEVVGDPLIMGCSLPWEGSWILGPRLAGRLSLNEWGTRKAGGPN